MIKRAQIGDPEMKMLNFPDNTNIFLLRDINYHTRIQSILNDMEKLLAQKQTFQKLRLYELLHIRIELRNQGKWHSHNCVLKHLQYSLLIPSVVTITGKIINNKIANTSNNKYDWIRVKFHNFLHHNGTENQLWH